MSPAGASSGRGTGAGGAAGSAGGALLSIIAWPDGAGRDDNARLVADATGMEFVTAKVRLGTRPPMIVAMFEDHHAQRAARAVEKAGGIAFAPTLAEIEWLGPTIKIRDMRVVDGRLLLDLWRHEPTSIAPGDIEVIIRGRTSETTVREAEAKPSFFGTPTLGLYGYGVLGSYGLAAGIYSWMRSQEASAPAAEVETRTAHKIDLHLRDGRVLQIDADKFGFQVLGDQRGLSDMVNAQRLCELLIHLAPGVTVDPYFTLWKPPIEIKRIRIPQMTLNRDDPAFALYSRWAALMYRYLRQRFGVLGDEAAAGE